MKIVRGGGSKRLDLELIRSQVSVRDVLEINGLDWGSAKRGVSPLRAGADNNQSFSISADGRQWYDFVEGIGGDVFALQMRLQGCEFREAAERLAKLAGGSPDFTRKDWEDRNQIWAENQATDDSYRAIWMAEIHHVDACRAAKIAADRLATENRDRLRGLDSDETLFAAMDAYYALVMAETAAELAQDRWQDWRQRMQFIPKRTITLRSMGYDPKTGEKLPLPALEDVDPAILLDLGLMPGEKS